VENDLRRSPIAFLATVTAVAAGIAGCAAPQISELRSMQPNADFVTPGTVDCLFQAGVEHVSSYLGQTEPRFVWQKEASGDSAWFRQPLTLIELRPQSSASTQVRRFQTPTAEALGQGNELLAFLRASPCKSAKAATR
jgi:hypothetical protein